MAIPGVAVRAVASSTALLVTRRARRDLSLLLSLIAVVSLATLLAGVSPRLVLATVDQGAREAVAEAGPRADVVVRTSVAEPTTSLPTVVLPGKVLALAEDLPARLPSALRQVTADTTATVLSPRIAASVARQADRAPDAPQLAIEIGMLTPTMSRSLKAREGSLPAAQSVPDDGSIGVVLSAAAATAASVEVGDVLHVARSPEQQRAAPSQVSAFTVVGIVAPPDDSNSDAPIWRGIPNMWAPITATSRARTTSAHRTTARTTPAHTTTVAITLLASPDGAERSLGLFDEPWDGDIRLLLDPNAFTGDLESRVVDEIDGLGASSEVVTGDYSTEIRIESEFDRALAAYPAEARASVAQMTVMIAGMLGVAATVVLLLSRLLVLRRSREVALDRARGASLASIGVTSLLESFVASAIGVAIGLAAAALVIPGALSDPLPVVILATVAVVSPPVLSVVSARAVWSGRRLPANRSDRLELVRRRRGRRVVIEATLVVLAGAALFSLRSRGLLQTRTDGVDPLLASAPLLLAVVVTLLMLRVYPAVVRAGAFLGRRSRGAMGILGAEHARRALDVLPVSALTLAVALALGGGLLIDTVDSGQVEASWQRIGADVRVEAPVTEDDVSEVAARKGVEAASSMLVTEGVDLDGGTSTGIGTLIAVDRRYADLLTGLPEDGRADMVADAEALTALGTSGNASDPLSILVDPELADRFSSPELTLRFGTQDLPVRIVGTVGKGPNGYLNDPFVFVDLASLSARSSEPIAATTLLIIGQGAPNATEELSAKLTVPDDAIHRRSEWLDDRQGRALVAGVTTMMTISAAAVSLFAIMTLLASAVASARARANALALLRTLGIGRRLGWWLALAELAPVVLAALVGGTVAGVGIVVILAPSLGLGALAGGLYVPDPSLSPAVILAVAGGAMVLLALAMGAEVVAQRNVRVTAVLRVGEMK